MARSKNTELRNQILVNAYQMFYEDGVDNVLMKDIADQSGISVSLLHHYYRRKEDLLVHIFYDMLYKIRTYILEDMKLDPGALGENAIVYPGVLYTIFYDTLMRDNNHLLRIYTGLLYDTELLRQITDYAFTSLIPPAALPSDNRSRLSMYTLNGALSQVVCIYLDSALPLDLKATLRSLIGVYFGGCGRTQEEQEKLLKLVDRLLPQPVLDGFYTKYLAGTDHFTTCNW